MDTRLRNLARLAATDPDARVEWLTQRLRLGTLDQKMLELAGYCGDAAARRLLNEDCSCGIGLDIWEHADANEGRCRDKYFMPWVRGFAYWGNEATPDVRIIDRIHDEVTYEVRPGNLVFYGREVILRAVLASTRAILSNKTLWSSFSRYYSAVSRFEAYVKHRSAITDIQVRWNDSAYMHPAFDFGRVLADLTVGWEEVLDAGSRLMDTRPEISKALIGYALRDMEYGPTDT